MERVTAAPTKCSEALAELERLLEPHMWVSGLCWEGGLINEAAVRGYVMPLGIPVDPLRGTAAGDHEPAEVRAALFASAQEAIRVVEAAGYAHRRHPVLTMAGDSATLRFTVRPPGRAGQ